MTDPHLDLLDDAVHAEAVADRARRRMISEADDQDATFASSLRAAAQSGGAMLVETTVGRTVRGRIDAVADRHVVVEDQSATTYVRIDQITAVRGVSGSPTVRATPAEDDVAAAAPLGSVLADLAHERSPIDVHLLGGAVVRGEVARVGTDVMTLRSPVTGDETLVNLDLAAVLTLHRGSG